jgi:hypothetical protein
MDYNGYYHEYFLRYRPDLLPFIHRIKSKGTGVRGKTDPDSEPDFYRMPFVTPIDTTLEIKDDTRPGQSTERHGDAEQKPYSFPRHDDRALAWNNPSPYSIRARPQVAQSPRSNARSPAEAHPNEQLVDLSPQRRRSTNIAKQEGSSPPLTLIPSRHPGYGAAVCAPDESSTFGDQLTLSSLLSYPSHGVPPNRMQNFPLHMNLEPTPLPPVYIRQGDGLLRTYSNVPVANHPGFVQIDYSTFVYAHTDSGNRSDEPGHPFSPNQHDSI